MLDHIGIEVSDLARSRSFYEAALEPLGIGFIMEFEGSVGMGSEGEHGPSPTSGSTPAAALRSAVPISVLALAAPSWSTPSTRPR